MQPGPRRLAKSSCSCSLLSGTQNREVAYQRQMIRELYIRYGEAIHLNLRAMQNEIQFLAGTAAWVGKQALGIGAAQARSLRKQINFVIAPISIEVPGDDHRLGGFAHQIIEVAQLILAVPELQRQMHQEYGDVIEFQFDDEAFDAGIEIVESLAANPGRCQKGVSLLAHDGHHVIDR